MEVRPALIVHFWGVIYNAMWSDAINMLESVNPANIMYLKLSRSEIRLITILPSDNVNDQVRCTLDHFDISERSYTVNYTASLRETPSEHQRNQSVDVSCEVVVTSCLPNFRYEWGDYMALSYTWGDPTKTYPILINGVTLQVTLNLEAALKVLRSKPYIKAGWKIWIDALCINQNDIIERATQVRRMREIYSKAWTPIIWLGGTSTNSTQAIQLISRLAEDHNLCNHASTLTAVLKRNSKAFGDGGWRAIHDFALRRFWSRVWILQEVSIGRANMPVLCGDFTLRWGEIHRVFKFLNTSDEIFNIYMKDELADVGRSFEYRIFETFGVVEEINEYQQGPELDIETFDLFNLMSLSRSVFATEPRDKIYGLFALMPEDLARRIQTDYRAPVEDIYTDFVMRTIDATQSLEILRHAGHAGSLSLKSWVPDWTTEHLVGSLGYTAHMASGHTMAQVSYLQSGLLSCRGFIADTIDGMGCVWRDASGIGWPASSIRQTTGRANPYGDFEGARAAIWRTMVANRDINVRALEKDYSSLLAVPAISMAQGSFSDEDLEAVASSHLLEYCNQFYGGNADFIIAGERVANYWFSQPNFTEIDSSTLRDALIARDRVNLYRRLFTTATGYVGIGPQDALQSDVICILFGCSMPLMLREVDGGFRLVGECYVHGLMNGEGLETWQRQGAVTMNFLFRE